MYPSGSPWRSKRREGQKKAIMEAVRTEEATMRVLYCFLPLDQIRGKVLQKLGIPSKVGGVVDWVKIGPDFNLRIVPPARVPMKAPSTIPVRKFFKSARPFPEYNRQVVRDLRAQLQEYYGKVAADPTASIRQRSSSNNRGRRSTAASPATTPATTPAATIQRGRKTKREEAVPKDADTDHRPKRRLFRVSSGDNPDQLDTTDMVPLFRTPTPQQQVPAVRAKETREEQDPFRPSRSLSSPDELHKARSKPETLGLCGLLGSKKRPSEQARTAAVAKAEEMTRQLLKRQPSRSSGPPSSSLASQPAEPRVQKHAVEEAAQQTAPLVAVAPSLSLRGAPAQGSPPSADLAPEWSEDVAHVGQDFPQPEEQRGPREECSDGPFTAEAASRRAPKRKSLSLNKKKSLSSPSRIKAAQVIPTPQDNSGPMTPGNEKRSTPPFNQSASTICLTNPVEDDNLSDQSQGLSPPASTQHSPKDRSGSPIIPLSQKRRPLRIRAPAAASNQLEDEDSSPPASIHSRQASMQHSPKGRSGSPIIPLSQKRLPLRIRAPAEDEDSSPPASIQPPQKQRPSPLENANIAEERGKRFKRGHSPDGRTPTKPFGGRKRREGSSTSKSSRSTGSTLRSSQITRRLFTKSTLEISRSGPKGPDTRPGAASPKPRDSSSSFGIIQATPQRSLSPSTRQPQSAQESSSEKSTSPALSVSQSYPALAISRLKGSDTGRRTASPTQRDSSSSFGIIQATPHRSLSPSTRQPQSAQESSSEKSMSPTLSVSQNYPNRPISRSSPGNADLARRAASLRSHSSSSSSDIIQPTQRTPPSTQHSPQHSDRSHSSRKRKRYPPDSMMMVRDHDDSSNLFSTSTACVSDAGSLALQEETDDDSSASEDIAPVRRKRLLPSFLNSTEPSLQLSPRSTPQHSPVPSPQPSPELFSDHSTEPLQHSPRSTPQPSPELSPEHSPEPSPRHQHPEDKSPELARLSETTDWDALVNRTTSMASHSTLRASVAELSWNEDEESDNLVEEPRHHVSLRAAAERALQLQHTEMPEQLDQMFSPKRSKPRDCSKTPSSRRSSNQPTPRRHAPAPCPAPTTSDSDSEEILREREAARLLRRESRQCSRASSMEAQTAQHPSRTSPAHAKRTKRTPRRDDILVVPPPVQVNVTSTEDSDAGRPGGVSDAIATSMGRKERAATPTAALPVVTIGDSQRKNDGVKRRVSASVYVRHFDGLQSTTSTTETSDPEQPPRPSTENMDAASDAAEREPRPGHPADALPPSGGSRNTLSVGSLSDLSDLDVDVDVDVEPSLDAAVVPPAPRRSRQARSSLSKDQLSKADGDEKAKKTAVETPRRLHESSLQPRKIYESPEPRPLKQPKSKTKPHSAQAPARCSIGTFQISKGLSQATKLSVTPPARPAVAATEASTPAPVPALKVQETTSSSITLSSGSSRQSISVMRVFGRADANRIDGFVMPVRPPRRSAVTGSSQSSSTRGASGKENAHPPTESGCKGPKRADSPQLSSPGSPDVPDDLSCLYSPL